MTAVTWTELLAGFASVLGLILLFDRVVQRLMAGQYVKRDELVAAERTLKTEQILQASNVKEAHHRIDLLAEVMKGLPGYGHVNDLKDEVAAVKRELAVSGEKLKSIGEDIHEMRTTLDRLREELRDRS